VPRAFTCRLRPRKKLEILRLRSAPTFPRRNSAQDDRFFGECRCALATISQAIGVAARIEDGNDSDFITAFPELDDKWKTLNDHPARAVLRRWKQSRVFENPPKASPHVIREANSKARLPCLVPRYRFVKFVFCNSFDDDLPAHNFIPNRRCSSAFTWSSGTTSSGFAMSSATRTAISASCAEVKAGADPSAVSDSQISFIKLTRCAAGRRLACSRSAAGSRSVVAMPRACRRFGKFASGRAEYGAQAR